MNRGSGYAAIPRGGKGHSQAGRRSRADRKIHIAKIRARERTKRNRLIALGNREHLWNIRGRVVVAVTRLRSRQRAGASSREMNRRSRNAAIASGGERDVQAGRRSCADCKIGVAKVLAREGVERNRLVRQ